MSNQAPGGGSGTGGSVIMIYGLPTNRLNCDHLFNLVCSYGNVLKVVVVAKSGSMMPHIMFIFISWSLSLSDQNTH